MQTKHSCTSHLQQWRRKGRKSLINLQPIMEDLVTKAWLDKDQQAKPRDLGIKCLLYEARKNLKNQPEHKSQLLEHFKEINPKMALAQVMTPRRESTSILKTKFGKSPQGSFCQLSAVIEDNFKVFCDTTSVTRLYPDKS